MNCKKNCSKFNDTWKFFCFSKSRFFLKNILVQKDICIQKNKKIVMESSDINELPIIKFNSFSHNIKIINLRNIASSYFVYDYDNRS